MVTVECDVGRGLPGVSVVGLGDAAVVQARDRIRSAMQNTGVAWPGSRVVMSLSPAAIPKAGSGYDVAMVCSILAARDRQVQRRLSGAVLVGELGLDGAIRGVPGVLTIVRTASQAGFQRVIIPGANLVEGQRAAVHYDIEVLYATHLTDLVAWLDGYDLPPVGEVMQKEGRPRVPDMADVVGQPTARRALEIAAAGGHAIMLQGPPGSGKSMLAERLPGILPPMQPNEQIEAAEVHSIAGDQGNLDGIWHGIRPFVSPHHSVTTAGLVGGGSGRLRPGAASLAHHGVLFIDEVAEARPSVIDSLRVPMEQRKVELVRAQRTLTFPAQFQLVMAANPCPCGAERAAECRCPSRSRSRYQARLSGPLKDRIDVFARTVTSQDALVQSSGEESTEVVAERVQEAAMRARRRWDSLGLAPEGTMNNSTVPSTLLRTDWAPHPDGILALEELLRDGTLTQRRIDRAIRVAWTMCDLDGAERPNLGHVMDAADMRSEEALAA